MNSMTMVELATTARRNASVAYAAQKFQVSAAYAEAAGAAREALDAEAEEYEATLALYSCFATAEAGEAAIAREADAIANTKELEAVAWKAFEAARSLAAAEEEEEVRAYEARCAAHEATLAALAEAEEEEDGWGDIAIEAMLRDLSSGDRDFLCGEESPEDIAQEWGDQGFNASEVRAWALRARCFRAEVARALTVLGLNPEDCRALVPQGDTVGYHVANGDMSPMEALLVLQA